MFGAIIVLALAPWLDTSNVRSGRYRPMLKWWFGILILDFFALMWLGAMPAEEPYATLSLIASAYWFGYFLIILPLLVIIEKPNAQNVECVLGRFGRRLGCIFGQLGVSTFKATRPQSPEHWNSSTRSARRSAVADFLMKSEHILSPEN